MNTIQKQLIYIIVLMNASHLDATTPMIVPRSQSFNTARQIVGWNNPDWGINRKPQESEYTSFNLIFEYTRTFRSNALAYSLFGNDLMCGSCDDAALAISGSDVQERGANDWLADYFGLPRDFQSTVSFQPIISNFILDFSFYASLNAWVDGMYFRIHGPFVHTKWNLNANECITEPGEIGYFQGYFSSEAVPTTNLNKNFLAYANGATPHINNNYDLYGEAYCLAGTYPFGPSGDPRGIAPFSAPPSNPVCSPLGDITWQSLCCSRINNPCDCDNDGLARNGFGELRFVLGYNFINDNDGDYHLGLGIYTAAPTGTKVGDQDECNSKGRYLFQPIVGNGHHWELGGQVTAHYIGWRNEEETKSFGLYIEANISHLFTAHQIRCFDLCSAGNNSRYMLAEKLASNVNSLPGVNRATGAPPELDPLGLEFGNVYAPVANITRSRINSSIGAQGDVAFSFAYQYNNFQWDIGYNFWARSCEKISLNKDCCSEPVEQWALKGDQRVYGFLGHLFGDHIFLAAKFPVTDSQATIHTGSNLRHVSYAGINPLEPNNFYGDDPLFLAPFVTTLPHDTIPIYTSQIPIFIEESDFNFAPTRGISNKLFTHFNWAMPDCNDSQWTPYIGIGAEVEFGSRDKGCCNTDCYTSTPPNNACAQIESCCSNCALSQWGVWIKVGSSYN
jgi:hypothetical protein